MPADTRPPAIAVMGPTASGKTAFAIELARRHGGELVSVDSALVYQGLDIGAAKPDAAERAGVPHHLLDMRQPWQPYSAAEFAVDARAAIEGILARGKLPVLAGGTGLYFRALLEGLAPMPDADPALRASLTAEAAQRGWAALHADLSRVDPAAAARIGPGDAQRIQRALEVWRLSGQPLSAWHTGRFDRARVAEAARPDEFRLLSLEPQERAWLHARIAQRFEVMLAEGFVPEVERLRARGDLDPGLPSMRCVGYRQAWEALDGLWPADELAERGIAATRQLAKRQLTWLRGMPQREVIAADGPDPVGAVLARGLPLLEARAR